MKGDGNIAVLSIKYGRGTQKYVRLSVEVRRGPGERGRVVARGNIINMERNSIVDEIAISASRTRVVLIGGGPV